MEYPLLLDFLKTRLKVALRQEQFNRQTIHLYRCGDCWLALEYSACLLEEQFHYKDDAPLIFHLTDRSRVVMVEIPASFVKRIMAGHEIVRKRPGYITINTGHSASDYVGWRKWILDD